MSLRIYGVARTRAFRGLWVAEEVGLAYERVPVEIGDAGGARAGILGAQSQWAAPGHRRWRFRVVGIARDHALPRQETFVRQTLSQLARRRGARLAMELLGGGGSRPRRQYLVAACGAVAAARAQRGAARRGVQSSRGPVQSARRGAGAQSLSTRSGIHGGRSQCRRRYQPRRCYGSLGVAGPESLVDALSRSTRGTQVAGAPDKIRRGNAGLGHPPRRAD